MTGPGDVVLYWRPGCGFCHMLRRELDRAGVERTDINIWDDREAAAVVRSHARGSETVPTVVIGKLGLVNPSATEVLAALRAPGSDLGGALAEPSDRGRPADPAGPDRDGDIFRGAAWGVLATGVWLALALVNPTTTYHLAPLAAGLAWPVAARAAGRHVSWSAGLLAAAGGAALVAGAAGVLAAAGALAGPALVGGSALAETGIVAGLGILAALWLARPLRPGPPPDRAGLTPVGAGGPMTTPDRAE